MEYLGPLLRLPVIVTQDPEVTLIGALAILGGLHHAKLLIRGLTLLVKWAKAELAELFEALADLLYELTFGHLGRRAHQAPAGRAAAGGKRTGHDRRWKAYRRVQAQAGRDSVGSSGANVTGTSSGE